MLCYVISVDIGHKSLPRHGRFTTQEVISLNTFCDILYSHILYTETLIDTLFSLLP